MKTNRYGLRLHNLNSADGKTTVLHHWFHLPTGLDRFLPATHYLPAHKYYRYPASARTPPTACITPYCYLHMPRTTHATYNHGHNFCSVLGTSLLLVDTVLTVRHFTDTDHWF